MTLTTKEISALIYKRISQDYNALQFLALWILDKKTILKIVSTYVECDEDLINELIENMISSIAVEGEVVQQFFNELMQKVWCRITENRKKK